MFDESLDPPEPEPQTIDVEELLAQEHDESQLAIEDAILVEPPPLCENVLETVLINITTNFSVSRLHCCAHTLQLMVKDALKLEDMTVILKKCQRIVRKGKLENPSCLVYFY